MVSVVVVFVLLSSLLLAFDVYGHAQTATIAAEQGSIGPNTLPGWHEDAQVQLGWIFHDPTNPQNFLPLPGWNISVGNIPFWDYNSSRLAWGHPGQWYIRIPNLDNDAPVKSFWISWVYDFDHYLTQPRTATNIAWFPKYDSRNYQYLEEWFDSDGSLTTNKHDAVYARVTMSIDIYPNPQYEDIWLGTHGSVALAREVYILTCSFTVLDVTDPVANAGLDRTVNEDDVTTLNGTASADNVAVAAYTWTFMDVTAKTLTGETPAYTFSNPGDYTITLNVTDAAGNWAIDTVVITVLDVTTPVADAGQDQTVNEGASVAFDGGGSTDNVGIVSYAWDFDDGTSETGRTTTHEYANPGTYTVTLTVEDTAGNQATNTVVITVNPTEASPIWVVTIIGIVAAGIVIAALIFWRRRKRS